MSSTLGKLYQPFPKWQETRELLVLEVHGKPIQSEALWPLQNKVSSREENLLKNPLTKEQMDDQKYHDFMLACDGLNTVFFKYDGNTKKWSFKFSHSKSPLGAASNSNHNNNFNEYDVFAADLLTKIHNIKQYVHEFQRNFHFGRCIAILADEISRFFDVEFKKMLAKLYQKPDVSKTHMQSIYLAVKELINSIEKFLLKVAGLCAVGGFLLNLIKQEQDSLNKLYHNQFHDILDRTYKRGMDFYMQIVTDWVNTGNLESDLFFEFFIWDVSKRRCSSAVGHPESLIIGSHELIYLKSFNPVNQYSLIDVRSFKRRYLIVPEMCPDEFSEGLRDDIIKIGLYNHVLMVEDSASFNANVGMIQNPGFKEFSKFPALIKSRYRQRGSVILQHLCNQLEFAILLEKLPVYFCGLNNSIIDCFVELTEDYDWQRVSRQQNVKLTQLNRFYQQAIDMSPLAKDPLSKMIALEFSIYGQVDCGHPPIANLDVQDRPFNDLEPVLFCKDSFRLAFPPNVFGLYQNLFRLRHALRRTYILLKRKHFSDRKNMTLVKLNELSLMIKFVHDYDNFVFGYKASKIIQQYLDLVKKGICAKTLDLDTFVEKQEQMLNKLHGTAFVSSIPQAFSNSMWALLTKISQYARGDDNFKSMGTSICNKIKQINQRLRQSDSP